LFYLPTSDGKKRTKPHIICCRWLGPAESTADAGTAPSFNTAVTLQIVEMPLMNRDAFLNQKLEEEKPKSPHKLNRSNTLTNSVPSIRRIAGAGD